MLIMVAQNPKSVCLVGVTSGYNLHAHKHEATKIGRGHIDTAEAP